MPSTEDTSLKDLFSKGDLRYMYCQTGNPPSMAPPKVVRMFKDHQDRNFYRMMDFTQSLGDHTMAILSIRQHTETFPRDRLDEMPNRVTFDSCLTHQSIGDCLAAHLGPLWGASIGEVVRSVEALTEDQPLLGGQRDIPGCKGIIEGSVSETDEPKSSLSLFHIVLTIYEGMEGKGESDVSLVTDTTMSLIFPWDRSHHSQRRSFAIPHRWS